MQNLNSKMVPCSACSSLGVEGIPYNAIYNEHVRKGLRHFELQISGAQRYPLICYTRTMKVSTCHLARDIHQMCYSLGNVIK